MYLAFIAVYLITCFNYVQYQKDLATRQRSYHLRKEKYKDLENNEFNLNNCTNTCLVKCCDADQFLDKNGTCKDAEFFENIFYNDINLGPYNWSVATKQINKGLERLKESFTVINRERKVVKPNTYISYHTYETFLLPDGSLYYYRQDQYPPHIIDVWPLYFCVDFEYTMTSTETKSKVVYQLLGTNVEDGESKEEIFKRKALSVNYLELGAGLLVSFVVIAILIFRARRKLLLRHLAFTYCAYFCSLMFAYILKMLHLAGIKAGLFDMNDCQYISPPLYFLLISTFCWPLILSYDLVRTLRCMLMNGNLNIIRLKKKLDALSFGRYFAFSWGVPFLMTMGAFALEKLHSETYNVMKPPFDSCFENEVQTTLYLHVPISILIVASSLLLLISSYDLWKLLKIVKNTSYNTERNRLRSIIHRKLFSLLMMIILINLIPELPILLYYVLLITSTINWFVLFTIFIFERNIFKKVYQRSVGGRKLITSFIILILIQIILPQTPWFFCFFINISILIIWFALLIQFLFEINIFAELRNRITKKYKKLEDEDKYSPMTKNIAIISNNNLDERKSQLSFLKVDQINEISANDVSEKGENELIESAIMNKDLNMSIIDENAKKGQSKLVADLEKVLTDEH